MQPIRELVGVARAHGIPVHSDAVAAVGQLPVDFSASGVGALSFTGHKLGGPQGVGALILADPNPMIDRSPWRRSKPFAQRSWRGSARSAPDRRRLVTWPTSSG